VFFGMALGSHKTLRHSATSSTLVQFNSSCQQTNGGIKLVSVAPSKIRDYAHIHLDFDEHTYEVLVYFLQLKNNLFFSRVFNRETII
jgi:hypothetical protein